MSILKEINDLNVILKAFALNIFLMPFWYASIFLFKNEFYTSSDSVIIIVMSFIFSISSSSSLTFVFSNVFSKFNVGNNNKEYDLVSNNAVSVLFLSIWLVILLFVVYSLGFLFNIYIYFYYYVIIYFTPIFFTYLLLFMTYINDKQKRKQNNKAGQKK